MSAVFATGSQAEAPAPGRSSLLADRNFRWLFGGSVVSMIGDQFTLIALPWLVLQLTGDTMALGLVLALVSLPRAVFILLGGALVDRHSPRRVLLVTKLASAAMLGLLAALGLAGASQLWMVDVLALGLGVVTAFSFPAAGALLPRAVAPAALARANALMMGMGQLAALAGPVLAGGLIAALSTPHAALAGLGSLRHGVRESTRGLSVAFALDAGSFALSAATLACVRLTARPARASDASVWADIAQAARAFWHDVPLRTLCLYFAAVSFFVGGPVEVALPVLASRQLPGGAASLGLLLAGHGAGVLAGMAGASMRAGWRLPTLGTTVLAIDAIAALILLPFGHITATWEGLLLLAPLGMLGGFVQVALFTWMQKRVPTALLGRTMSLFMFCILGLSPLAAAAAGTALRFVAPSTLFTACGLALLVIVAAGAVLTPIRRIVDVDDPSPADDSQGVAVAPAEG